MQAPQATAKPWHRTCSRCRKAAFEDLLDERGLCDYCGEVIAMKVSSRRKAGVEAAPQKVRRAPQTTLAFVFSLDRLPHEKPCRREYPQEEASSNLVIQLTPPAT